METKRKHGILAKLGYACGDFYGGGSFLIISTLHMGYLILVLGLSPIQTSMILFVGRLWDAISDPIMGYITDRTKKRQAIPITGSLTCVDCYLI